MQEAPTIFIICGPTAIGKTAFAIELAQAIGTEIISADSRQCYQELGIAVAKPSAKELAMVPHHFINSHSIHDSVNAGVFEQYALQKSASLLQQYPSIVMVGGTGLYIKAFTDGMDAMPDIAPAIRAQLIADYEQNGLEWLQTQVQLKDPAFWEQAEQQNPQRLMRGLEFILSTGTSILDFRKAEKKQRPFQVVKIGLELPREILYQRINQRVDQMLDHGLLEEARALVPFQTNNALQTVGYQELFAHFKGEISATIAIEQIKQHTRQYAKRQMTWFKKETSINWMDASNISVEKVLELKS
ncbi:MAG: tRNA (adenosine(37)-N6)-dimethylallyltransferase MiaA [Bacteroidetes bacterium 24-39-8]|nr:MAG: tRNA (adenosine(37)-N6)-dimethylallyltransferase MiaA [Sphingobacteriia bacterium 35-40-8]OYZ50907.1 MAG: tRNA (adenosine(37)-N6)-dimethylallyltransferase MiaA [Bacteroidetes bacterium 24-39-8]OZA62207.1 MAG: tRNA (adenosine(37)-N6)-dimethylallyltransferase MiaA [Sphingobacteriia bacterium 39-39-8]HQS55957.1 tRNA (adenosine(37)-N6)-dimethylallyltransferase MiaA [Sediminibacterium sp.]